MLEPLLSLYWLAGQGDEKGECGTDRLGGDHGENIPGFALRGLDFEIRRGEVRHIAGKLLFYLL